jgi:glycerol-3-phosphate dehydrogenase (NAD(P)+)
VLTCTGTLSRNWTLGNKLGQGMKLNDILSQTKTVAEGVKTTKSVFDLSKKIGVEMPIAEQVYYILYENRNPKEALKSLMTRELKHEHEED